jgi:membrane-associated protease RseP (regulator of RpoE activity)
MLPLPPLATGTLGAFIRIREPIPTKRILFDIGAAGPFAGFLVLLPALFIGTALSPVVALPPNPETLTSLGDPLIVKFAAWLTWGSIADGYSMNMHPMFFGAWFGLLATSMNLFPIGQLDGGHIAYAVFGRRSSIVTVASICVAIGLAFISASWVVWTVLLVAMTLAMGPHHPKTIDEHVPLDRTRRWLALAALIMLIVCFTYNPIQIPDF